MFKCDKIYSNTVLGSIYIIFSFKFKKSSVPKNYCPIFYGSSGNWVETEDM